ncbi:autotransporter-associated beta strand repeat-containing protein [Prosthecobacter sp.]|uniref:beta strand repeat-containing protein n=1 Tax=Prosthecobacter sp. TaxID=1965333 RepID=UPI002487697D|nr:autotransporter-associated beta strand repeat-containing protein [Prosthecobacter sp.]MDI1313369.1 autotransporter-associated beta strand repeat-containing protein [Prosthecobacter sp.]
MRHPFCLLLALFYFCLSISAEAEPTLLTWDGTPGTLGVIDNVAGTWTNLNTNNNWYNGASNQPWDPTAIAQFGSLNSTLGATITVNEAISVAGFNFLPLSGTLSGAPFQFSGTGSVNLGSGATINISTNATNSSGNYVRFNVPLIGSNLTIAKADGTLAAFFDLAAANPNLTGTLTLKSSAAGGGVFAVLRPASITGLSGIVVEAGSTAYISVTNAIFSTPITAAGTSPAIRVDSTGNTFTGTITLSGNMRFHTSVNVVSTAITSAITETAGGSKNFTRSATVAANSIVPVTMTYSGASNYTGTTTFGTLTALLSTSDTGEGGVNVLNFASATAPDNNIFYNGVTANTLVLVGGTASATTLKMIGAVGETNSQTFSGLTLQQGSTGVEVISDVSGTANLNLGAITRSAFTSLSIKGPASGSITATYGGLSDTFLGPWATYIAGDGVNASWASLVGGKVSLYTGNLDHVTGTAIGVLPGYAATANLRVSATSTGAVTASGTTNIATVSMTDASSTRILDIGSGNTLRLATLGGIQMIKGAQEFTVGTLGDTSILMAGGTTNNVAGELYLTNLSSTGSLIINSLIRNNGTGATTLILNGTGRTILTGANDFSGHVIVNSGVLEVRNNTALGVAAPTASLTKIMIGASLNISGGITLAEGIQTNGHGIALDGSIRSLSDGNIISGVIRAQSSTRIASDTGLLTLSGGIVAQTTSIALYFSGAGNTEITGTITGTTPILFKDGSGTLTLSTSMTNGGITTVTNGALRLNFSGLAAPATNILYTGTGTIGALSMSNGSSLRVTGKTATVNSQAFTTLTFTTAGKYTLSVDQNAATSVKVNFTTITRPAYAIVQFDSTALAGFTTTTGTTDTLLTSGLVPYATVGLNDWAATATANASKNIVGLSTITGGYTTASLSGNADVTASTSISADTTVTTLRFNTNTGGLTTLSDTTNGTKYLTTSGILVTPGVGANDVLISVGALRTPSGDTELVIIQNNTLGALRISSKITNNAAATPVATTIVKAGLGTVIMESGNIYNQGNFPSAYYSGATRIQEGALQYVSTLAGGTTLLYPVYSIIDFILGSGTTSAKLVIGSGTSAVNLFGALSIEGTGTTNSVVGGSSTLSGFTNHKPGVVRDFRNGIIGGGGTYENNLTLTLYDGTLQLGSVNTYAGKTTINKDFLEVQKLANTGFASSLGTGDFDAANSIIDLAAGVASVTGSTISATLRYTGSTDSVTNRVVNLAANGSVTNTTFVNGTIENTGTGTVKFTTAFTTSGANTAQRTLTLGGTNTGDNSIVGMGNATSSPTAPGVKLEKAGTGTWIITGDSTYSGGTTVTAGTLLVGNSTMTGSATGTGAVAVSAGATLGGNGRIAAAADKSITIVGGTLSVGIPSATSAGILQLVTSGTGTLSLDQNSTLVLDLFSGVGQNNTLNPSAADILAVTGTFTLGTGTTLKVSNPNSLTGFTSNDQWKLFDWTNLSVPVTGTFAAFDLPTLDITLQWDLSQIYTTGILLIAPVPEPSRTILLFLALATLAARRRRSPGAVAP